jgi:hypothetical protein
MNPCSGREKIYEGSKCKRSIRKKRRRRRKKKKDEEEKKNKKSFKRKITCHFGTTEDKDNLVSDLC